MFRISCTWTGCALYFRWKKSHLIRNCGQSATTTKFTTEWKETKQKIAKQNNRLKKFTAAIVTRFSMLIFSFPFNFQYIDCSWPLFRIAFSTINWCTIYELFERKTVTKKNNLMKNNFSWSIISLKSLTNYVFSRFYKDFVVI